MAMTSTVLDVTVLLLCVSASVVTLGASGVGGPEGPTASDAADRLVTETATVTYPDGGAPNDTRRVHATRAELLALVAERVADGGTKAAFDRRAVDAVRTGVGPRTRVDVTVDEPTRTDERVAGVPERYRTRGESSSTASFGSSAGETRWTVAVGPEPPRDATVSVAVVRQPLPGGTDVGSAPDTADAGAVVRIVVRRW
ncbi:hypothetical protein EXE46_09950 [Halorubrum sp. GN11_10-6_MGM]|uniref:DUF7284 family protein n=1 Tax=Halorubrum sp. GN11_10-6_MGM TaxID=2518112 RepID=UPI0010F4BD32|nr:hypothetical protein [Halorubrum sp. GN11_10-6_MGM]TKX74288.1 hypothetical protein EXE46_09950 [Halorubrum sp. GN11_10-6_MGM]